MRFPSFLAAMFCTFAFLSACSGSPPDSPDVVVPSRNPSETLKGWIEYRSDQGYTVLMPGKWNVEDVEGKGIAIYNPAINSTSSGAAFRVEQKILVEQGKASAIIALDSPEQGVCGKRINAKIGLHKGLAQTCTLALDGSIQKHFFLQHGENVVHFVWRSDKGTDGVMKRIRESILFSE